MNPPVRGRQGPEHTIPGVALTNEVSIPQLGLGLDRVPPEEATSTVLGAIEAGYRHIDTAKVYGNEVEVGRAILTSGLDRSSLFVTTKCSNDDHGYKRATQALKRSLRRLRLKHVDLYLIHWPVPSEDRYVETWQALVDAQKAGLARAIGVSNFEAHHLRRIVDETGVIPAVNQIELHPYLQQSDLRREHGRLGIVTQGWSPLAQGRVLDDPAIVSIAEKQGKTPAQVVLRWHVELGNVIFPKSVTAEHIRENIDVFDFGLGPEDLAEMEVLDRGRRIGPDPAKLTLNPPASRWRRVRVSIGATRRRLVSRARNYPFRGAASLAHPLIAVSTPPL